MSASAQLRPTAAPAITTPAFDPDLATALGRQRARIRRREFLPLGALDVMFVEGSGIAVIEGNSLRSAKLDWYHTGPLLALSEDEREILVCSPMPPPPPIPDPRWTQPCIYDEHGFLIREKPPMVDQDLQHLAAGAIQLGAKTWLVFQPISELLLISQRKQGWLGITWHPDAQGRHGCLLYHPPAREAHFLYGRPEVNQYGR